LLEQVKRQSFRRAFADTRQTAEPFDESIHGGGGRRPCHGDIVREVQGSKFNVPG